MRRELEINLERARTVLVDSMVNLRDRATQIEPESVKRGARLVGTAVGTPLLAWVVLSSALDESAAPAYAKPLLTPIPSSTATRTATPTPVLSTPTFTATAIRIEGTVVSGVGFQINLNIDNRNENRNTSESEGEAASGVLDAEKKKRDLFDHRFLLLSTPTSTPHPMDEVVEAARESLVIAVKDKTAALLEAQAKRLENQAEAIRNPSPTPDMTATVAQGEANIKATSTVRAEGTQTAVAKTATAVTIQQTSVAAQATAQARAEAEARENRFTWQDVVLIIAAVGALFAAGAAIAAARSAHFRTRIRRSWRGFWRHP